MGRPYRAQPSRATAPGATGTNERASLVLLRKDHEHIGLTNEQTRLTEGLNPGGTRTIDFPMPPARELIWPR